MKVNHCGQASLWTPEIIKKMRSRLLIPKHRLIFEIGLYTGERIGAICALKVEDIYNEFGKINPEIHFEGKNRKSSKHGVSKSRDVHIHPDLMIQLQHYDVPSGLWLFPTNSRSGHISPNAVDKYWRKIFCELNLKGYSTHSSRRFLINQLRQNAVEIITIAEIMGMSISTVRHYLDEDPIACKQALMAITI
jgi:integrase/recombinase XerD